VRGRRGRERRCGRERSREGVGEGGGKGGWRIRGWKNGERMERKNCGISLALLLLKTLYVLI